MRKQLALAFCASLCLASPVLAQSDAAPPPDAGAGSSDGAGAAKGKMQELVQGCRKQARAQGLTPQSHEMRQAVMDCVVKQKPGMAKAMGCRMEAMDKGMKPGSDDIKSYVKDCMKRS